MYKYLEKENELEFHKIFNQVIGMTTYEFNLNYFELIVIFLTYRL